MSRTSLDLCNGTGKIFQDSVHGSMEMHDLLVKIIDTPEFQRLRNLVQTSMTYLVYPGASHRRYEHSLGVCHLAAVMLDALSHNSPEEMQNVTREEKLCVLIAGLCHDLGHGPFSHTWESFVNLAGKEFEHETLSTKVFLHILDAREGQIRKEFERNNLGDREIKLIQELIDGRGIVLPANKRFLYEIVANKQTDIDVDKWDYFLRDGQALGLKITFDYQRLLKFTKVIVKNDRYSIGYRDKEKCNVDDMFRMRAELHMRAYQHPVAKKIEAMILDGLLVADAEYKVKVGKDKVRLSEAHENIEVFLKLNDCILDVIKMSDDPKLEKTKEILDRIERREHYYDLQTYDIRYEDAETSPKRISGEILRHIIRTVQEEFEIAVFPAQILVTTGMHRDPTSKVLFYSKSSLTRNIREYPKIIRYDLPYSKLNIYSRNEITEEMRKKVSDHILHELTNNGVLADVGVLPDVEYISSE